MIANWVAGALFAKLNEQNQTLSESQLTPEAFAQLMDLISEERVNAAGARQILEALFDVQKSPAELMQELGLEQVSAVEDILAKITKLIEENPDQVSAYQGGREELLNWFFGQVMVAFQGKANPKIVRETLQSEFAKFKPGD